MNYITKKDEKLLKELINLSGEKCAELHYSHEDLSKIINFSVKDIKTSLYSLEKQKLINIQPSYGETLFITIPSKSLYYFEQKERKIKMWILKKNDIIIMTIIASVISFLIGYYFKECQDAAQTPSKNPTIEQVKINK